MASATVVEVLLCGLDSDYRQLAIGLDVARRARRCQVSLDEDSVYYATLGSHRRIEYEVRYSSNTDAKEEAGDEEEVEVEPS